MSRLSVSAAKAAIAETKPKLTIVSSKEFVAGFTPPDYLIDTLAQRRYLYSMTAPTGAGKTCITLRLAAHVATGAALAGREVVKSRVLYLAGENPDDVRARWIKLSEEMSFDPDVVEVHFLPGTADIEKDRKQIHDYVERNGELGLVIVDTSAAYFHGQEENSNTELGNHARTLRTLVELPGGPTVIVTCHPTKNPDMTNLLPRGGGAFIAEVDGNLVCLKDGSVTELHWHGKFRGPDFEAIPFELRSGKSDKLVDSKGRHVWTVTARPISEASRDMLRDTAGQRERELLALMKAKPGLSLMGMAKEIGWTNSKRDPDKRLVQTTLTRLEKSKLVEKQGNAYALTAKGKKQAGDWQGPAQADLPI